MYYVNEWFYAKNGLIAILVYVDNAKVTVFSRDLTGSEYFSFFQHV